MSTPLVVTIASGKGGVGKTFFAANLALAAHRKGLSTVLWDADVLCPNVHILFGEEPEHRADSVYAGMMPAAQALYRTSYGLPLLAGKSMTLENPAPAFRSVLTSLFTAAADLVVIDTAAGAGDDVVQCCAMSDLVFLVINEEPTSIIDAYGLVKILASLEIHSTVGLVVNGAEDMQQAEELAAKFSLATDRFLGHTYPLLGYMPWDADVRRSIIQQKPLVASAPTSEIAATIAVMAASLEAGIKSARQPE